MIEHERDRRREAAKVVYERHHVVESAGSAEEAALRRLDRPTVELDDAGAGFMRALDERPHQRRLAHPGDPMEGHHARLATQEFLQDPKLRLASDEGDPAPLRDRRGDESSMYLRNPAR